MFQETATTLAWWCLLKLMYKLSTSVEIDSFWKLVFCSSTGLIPFLMESPANFLDVFQSENLVGWGEGYVMGLPKGTQQSVSGCGCTFSERRHHRSFTESCFWEVIPQEEMRLWLENLCLLLLCRFRWHFKKILFPVCLLTCWLRIACWTSLGLTLIIFLRVKTVNKFKFWFNSGTEKKNIQCH